MPDSVEALPRVNELITELQLMPHPEGGYFTETYRSNSVIDSIDRNTSTAIYYLLRSDEISRFHRIKSDEVWHHYEGSPVTIHVIHQDSLYEALYLGKEISKGQKPQHVVPAGAWFGVTVDDPDSYTLCGCTVAPGFDFNDFEMGNRYQMLQAFPEHEAIIKTLLPN